MNCTACNSQNIQVLTKPEPVLDMPEGIFAAKTECSDCGSILPMAFTAAEVAQLCLRFSEISSEHRIGGIFLSDHTKEKSLYKLELTLVGLPQRANEAPGASWHSRHRESQKWHKRVLGRMLLERKSPPHSPLTKVHLSLVRHSSRAPDFDGLVHSFKPVIDALKKCLIIKDDNMNVIGQPDYRWEKSKPKEGKIQITVKEIAS